MSGDLINPGIVFEVVDKLFDSKTIVSAKELIGPLSSCHQIREEVKRKLWIERKLTIKDVKTRRDDQSSDCDSKQPDSLSLNDQLPPNSDALVVNNILFSSLVVDTLRHRIEEFFLFIYKLGWHPKEIDLREYSHLDTDKLVESVIDLSFEPHTIRFHRDCSVHSECGKMMRSPNFTRSFNSPGSGWLYMGGAQRVELLYMETRSFRLALGAAQEILGSDVFDEQVMELLKDRLSTLPPIHSLFLTGANRWGMLYWAFADVVSRGNVQHIKFLVDPVGDYTRDCAFANQWPEEAAAIHVPILELQCQSDTPPMAASVIARWRELRDHFTVDLLRIEFTQKMLEFENIEQMVLDCSEAQVRGRLPNQLLVRLKISVDSESIYQIHILTQSLPQSSHHHGFRIAKCLVNDEKKTLEIQNQTSAGFVSFEIDLAP